MPSAGTIRFSKHLWLGCFAVAIILVTSRGPAATPGYLSKMPAAADVTRRVQGADAADTAGKQHAVFRELSLSVRTLSQGGEFGDTMTPEERALLNSYGAASQEALKRCAALKGKLATCQPSGRPLLAQTFPEIAALRDDRKEADLDAADRVLDHRDPTRLSVRSIYIPGAGTLIMLLGVLICVAAGKALGRAKTASDAIRREEFHRRTSERVLEFETFEQAEAHRVRRMGNTGEALGGIVLLLFGFGVMAVGAALWLLFLTSPAVRTFFGG